MRSATTIALVVGCGACLSGNFVAGGGATAECAGCSACAPSSAGTATIEKASMRDFMSTQVDERHSVDASRYQVDTLAAGISGQQFELSAIAAAIAIAR